jgi:hypothetical protein
VQLFGIYSDLNLFSNFTYFLVNPEQGDQFNQREQRVVVGGSASHAQQIDALGASHTVTVGLQSRADVLSPVGLYRTERRARLGVVRQDDVSETGTGVFVEAQSRWRPWFRSTLGVRADGYTFDVTSDRVANSGRRSAAIVSPKASLVFANPVGGWRSTIALWALELDSELLFTGDGGATEPSDRSMRSGVTLANFYRPVLQLSIDADVSLARARFTGVAAAEDRIPGAIENVVAAGVTWSPARRGPFGAIRVRRFGTYPLVEDNSVRATATTLFNADAGFMVGGARLQATVLNLLNARASDIQYYYASRLPGEVASGSGDIHFHPVEPRQVRISLGWGL